MRGVVVLAGSQAHAEKNIFYFLWLSDLCMCTVERRPNRALIADPDAMKPYQRFKYEGDMLDGENAILDRLLTFDTEANSRAARKPTTAEGSSLQERQHAGFDSQNTQSPNSQSEDHLRSQRYRNRFELFGQTGQLRPKKSQSGDQDGVHMHDPGVTTPNSHGQAARHVSRAGGIEPRVDGERSIDGSSTPRVLQQSGVTKAMLAHPRFKREVKRDWKVVPLQLACTFNRQKCDADTLFFRLGIQASLCGSCFFCVPCRNATNSSMLKTLTSCLFLQVREGDLVYLGVVSNVLASELEERFLPANKSRNNGISGKLPTVCQLSSFPAVHL